MIDIKYQPQVKETAQATLTFLEHRPLLKYMLLFMKMAIYLLVVGFILKSIGGNASHEDLAIVLTAFVWLYGRRAFNQFMLVRNLKKNKHESKSLHYQVSPSEIHWQEPNHPSQKIGLNKLPFILKNKIGYIIPLTGLSQSAKFLWFPKRAFESTDSEHQFLTLLKNKAIKIKPV